MFLGLGVGSVLDYLIWLFGGFVECLGLAVLFLVLI